jgi:hypothetical protein
MKAGECRYEKEAQMRKKRKPNWGCIGGIFLVLFWTAAGIWELVRHFQEKSTSNVFESMNDQARSICDICFSQVKTYPALFGGQFDSYLPYSPYLRGKALVVEANTGKAIGSTMVALSSEIAAASLEEVNTLVCAGEINQVQVSTYTDNQPGYMLIRNFCVFDMGMENVIFAAEIYGGRPPPTKSVSGPGSGTDPAYDPLIKILEGLPVK